MKKLILMLSLLISQTSFANHSHYVGKITDIIEYGDYFNGTWRDSWGQTSTVTNTVYFPAYCKMAFAGSKKSDYNEYTISSQIDFANHPIVKIEKSNLSSSVKIIFSKAVVDSVTYNPRTGERRRNKEKVASFYFRPSDGRNLYQNLVDVLISYRAFCTKPN